ncbi:MAG: hypothetical protein RLZZ450_5931 [Pseudomonadota bacterium]
MSSPKQASLSLRWLRPFLRITGAHPAQLALFAREGIQLRDLANPDARYSHRLAMLLLAHAIESTGNTRIGLAAGESLEPGDMDVLEYAARACETMREAIFCTGRYMCLMHDGQQVVLREQDDWAIWEMRQVDDIERLPASNDFTLVAACTFARRHAGWKGQFREVHFQHPVATDMAEYERIFEGATIKLGMPHNALVIDRTDLDRPMLDANPGMRAAYELHASRLLEQLRPSDTLTSRVRQLLVEQLRAGNVGMDTVATKVAMSTSTLRRRLAEEGTTHTTLLDELRSELAEKYLTDPALAIGEIAFLLGFSHVTAFYNAFRRWRGTTPAEFRAARR